MQRDGKPMAFLDIEDFDGTVELLVFGDAYEKFRGTLQRNKDALVARHGCSRVTFRVYEKQGKTALKASPAK